MIGELRADKQQLESTLTDSGEDVEEASLEEIGELLISMPNLVDELQRAPMELKRRVFEAFDLQITYDKVGGRVEITATVSEAIAEAFENVKALQKEGSQVVARDIAGAGFEPATFGL